MEELKVDIAEINVVEQEAIEVQQETMDDYKDEINKSLKKLHTGDIVSGKVLQVLDDGVLVDIGSYAEGTIKSQELSNDPAFSLHTDIKEGEEIQALILQMDDGNGSLVLSRRQAENATAWEELLKLFEEKTVVQVKISQVVKGGVVAYLKGVRGFIPASQLSVDYVEHLEDWLSKEVSVIVITCDPEKQKLVLSGKEVEKEQRYQEKRTRLFEINKGDYVEGTVKKLMDFGAFVDIGGIDGLIRNQDLSWNRIKHPSEVVEAGQKVKVLVLDVDRNSEKIGLALKDINENPADEAIKKLKVGSIVKGIVEKLMTYGAFVKLAVGVEGLLHVSEISEKRIANPSDVLTVGQEVTVKILEMKQGRISLSIKEAEYEKDRELQAEYVTDEEATTSLGAMLKNLKL